MGTPSLSFAGNSSSPRNLFKSGWEEAGLRARRCWSFTIWAGDLGFPQLLPFEYYLHLRWVRDSFDLFHFHDLIGAISYETMIALSRHKPVVFTVHDCSAFTGGCVYPEGCENYKMQCGQCPQLGVWPMVTTFDHTGHMLELRRRAASQRNIQYVFPQ